ncbi:unknown [Sinorhizobium phage PBC5]|nr:unknown [Sinorhizobium phage PBC5]
MNVSRPAGSCPAWKKWRMEASSAKSACVMRRSTRRHCSRRASALNFGFRIRRSNIRCRVLIAFQRSLSRCGSLFQQPRQMMYLESGNFSRGAVRRHVGLMQAMRSVIGHHRHGVGESPSGLCQPDVAVAGNFDEAHAVHVHADGVVIALVENTLLRRRGSPAVRLACPARHLFRFRAAYLSGAKQCDLCIDQVLDEQLFRHGQERALNLSLAGADIREHPGLRGRNLEGCGNLPAGLTANGAAVCDASELEIHHLCHAATFGKSL